MCSLDNHRDSFGRHCLAFDHTGIAKAVWSISRVATMGRVNFSLRLALRPMEAIGVIEYCIFILT
jgi:hypothetical protein